MLSEDEEMGMPDEILVKMGMPTRAEMEKWLDENVTTFDVRQKVTFSDFRFAAGRDLRGVFTVRPDDESTPQALSFNYGWAPQPQWRAASFHSPLGVPASFPSVEFTPDARRVISWGLEALLPRLSGFSPGVGNELPAGFDLDALRTRLQEPSFSFAASLANAGISSSSRSDAS